MEVETDNSEGIKDSFKVPSLPLPPVFAKPNDSNKSEKSVKQQSDLDHDNKQAPVYTPEETSSSTPENKSTSEPQAVETASTPPAPPCKYEEPSWGGVPETVSPYYLEILKNGIIVDKFKLEGKSFFTVGRLPICDVPFEHPSLSRYHAVLQYKVKPSPEKPVGFYLYDLDSTHGTQHNKLKCFPRTYYRLRVGHMIKFGGSTRMAILQGPDEDQEDESEMTVTELKALAEEKAKKKAEEEERMKKLAEEAELEDSEKSLSKGISWGMGDEADEEFPDMEKNPFAELANNENLYIEDPKKCLRNWFDREGFDLEYKTEEKGFSQFYCRIELPVDGQPNFAEAEVKGKKKEAVVQAALEACRVLDRLGLLKQSQQTRMERKVKKWEDDDYYDSDDDEFLDRTGDIEAKRQKRMKMAGVTTDTVETYDSLKKKFDLIEIELKELNDKLAEAQKLKAQIEKAGEGDLDNYLANLKKGDSGSKENVTKLKTKINQLNTDKDKLIKLINIAKPTHMPELKSTTEKPKAGIMIGKMGSRGFLGKIKNVSKSSVAKPVVVSSERTKVLEAFLQEDEEKSKKLKTCDDGDEDELQPIGYEVHKPVKAPKKDRIGDTSKNEQKVPGKPVNDRKIGPIIPDNIKEANSKVEENNPEMTPDPVVKERDPKTEDDSMSKDSTETEVVVKKRGDRGTKRKNASKQEPVIETKEEYYKIGEDSKYDVWMPPENQSGDGKTSLNAKLGY